MLDQIFQTLYEVKIHKTLGFDMHVYARETKVFDISLLFFKVKSVIGLNSFIKSSCASNFDWHGLKFMLTLMLYITWSESIILRSRMFDTLYIRHVHPRVFTTVFVVQDCSGYLVNIYKHRLLYVPFCATHNGCIYTDMAFPNFNVCLHFW